MNLVLPLMPEFGPISNPEKLNLINVESNSPLLSLICKHVMKMYTARMLLEK